MEILGTVLVVLAGGFTLGVAGAVGARLRVMWIVADLELAGFAHVKGGKDQEFVIRGSVEEV